MQSFVNPWVNGQANFCMIINAELVAEFKHGIGSPEGNALVSKSLSFK